MSDKKSGDKGRPPASVHQSFSGHKKKRTFKVIVIGDSGVGKTCLTFRFCSGHFPGASTEATIGVDFREKIIRLEDGEEVRLQFWDTAGQERFRRSMVSHYYRNVSAVVFVYDVTQKDSFDAMVNWIAECDKHGLHTGDRVPMIMVGNKAETGLKHAVNTNEAQRFADDHGMPLFETSAKDDSKADHVESIFLTLAHKVKRAKALLEPLKDGANSREGSVSGGRRLSRADTGKKSASSGWCCSGGTNAATPASS